MRGESGDIDIVDWGNVEVVATVVVAAAAVAHHSHHQFSTV